MSEGSGAPAAKRESAWRYGFWSLVFAAISLALLVASALRVMQAVNGPQLDEGTAFKLISTVVAVIFAAGFNLVGAIMGVASLGYREPRRAVGWAGLVLNLALIAGGGWIASELIFALAGI